VRFKHAGYALYRFAILKLRLIQRRFKPGGAVVTIAQFGAALIWR
jgi:hypothetical protein